MLRFLCVLSCVAVVFVAVILIMSVGDKTSDYHHTEAVRFTYDGKEYTVEVKCDTQVRRREGVYYCNNEYTVSLPDGVRFTVDGIGFPGRGETHSVTLAGSRHRPERTVKSFEIRKHDALLASVMLPIWE